jgi:hypothetical protein
MSEQSKSPPELTGFFSHAKSAIEALSAAGYKPLVACTAMLGVTLALAPLSPFLFNSNPTEALVFRYIILTSVFAWGFLLPAVSFLVILFRKDQNSSLRTVPDSLNTGVDKVDKPLSKSGKKTSEEKKTGEEKPKPYVEGAPAE